VNTLEFASSTNVTVISSPSEGLDYTFELKDKCGISVVSKDILGSDIDSSLIIIVFLKDSLS